MAHWWYFTEITNKGIVPDRATCKSGTYFKPEEKCILDFYVYGDVTGCRDLSHLDDCGK